MNAKRVAKTKGTSIYSLSSFFIMILVINLVTTVPKMQAAGLVANDWICIPGRRVGPITAVTTEKQLIGLFGNKNVVTQEFHVDEGYFEVSTIVFQDTPNQIQILWKDKAQNIFKKPERVIIDKKGTKWKTQNGITIGTTLKELVRINGAFITFAGFGWDYGGVILDWHKGKLAGQPISVRLAPANFIEIPGTSGDGARLTSTDKRLEKLNLYVYRIDFIFK
jgi:hypothetical protein